MSDVVRQGSFARSVRHAWTGLVHTVAHQRNMRVHVVSAMLVMLVGSGIPLGLAEKVTLIFCVQLVFFAEILNSALEALVDLATEKLHDNARITKDAAAAAVLVLTIGTVVIFAALLVHDWSTVVTHGAAVQRQALLGVPLALCGVGLLRRDHRRPWIDLLLLLGALLLWALTLLHTESWVFSALLLGLVGLAFATARTMSPAPARPPRRPVVRGARRSRARRRRERDRAPGRAADCGPRPRSELRAVPRGVQRVHGVEPRALPGRRHPLGDHSAQDTDPLAVRPARRHRDASRRPDEHLARLERVATSRSGTVATLLG